MRQDAGLTKILSQIETGETVEESTSRTALATRDVGKSGGHLGINVVGQVNQHKEILFLDSTLQFINWRM